jgi:hypothetical protein
MFTAKKKVGLVFLLSLICTLIASVSLLTFPNRTIAIKSTHESNQLHTEPLPIKTLPTNAIASNKINYSLLIGEWADKGKCNSYRHVFTRDKRYKILERKQGKWKTLFNGFYLVRDANIVSMGETVNPTEYGLIISKLTDKTLIATFVVESDEVPDLTPTSWVRCPNR